MTVKSPITGVRSAIYQDSGVSLVQSLLLDAYSGAAAAFSLRKLRNAYSGSAIRVRRSSDNAEQDIGFSSGDLDIASLLSFCDAGNGFVTKWYDQSGNSIDLSQSSTTLQPQVVSSGAVVTQGTKPAVQFDGSNDCLDGVDTGLPTGAATFVTLSRHSSASLASASYGVVFSYGQALTGKSVFSLYGTDANIGTNGLGMSQFGDSTGQGSRLQVANLQYITKPATTGTWSQWINSGTATTKSMTTATALSGAAGSFRVGQQSLTGGAKMLGTIQELIIWASALASERTAIETQLNTYYSVY